MKKIMMLVIFLLAVAGLCAETVFLKDSSGEKYKFEKSPYKVKGHTLYKWEYTGEKLFKAMENAEDIFNMQICREQPDSGDETTLTLICTSKKTGDAMVLVSVRVQGGMIFFVMSEHNFKSFR